MPSEPEFKLFLPFVAKAQEGQPVKSHTLFLPLIMNEGRVQFRIERTRLWLAAENGARDGRPCGSQGRVQVHVFGDNGGVGDPRLDNVVLSIAHFKNGQSTVETRLTGAPGAQPGMVEFELHDFALVGVVADVGGKPAVSDAALVSTVPSAIDPHQLIQFGYCTDADSCRQFVAANTCAGQFSWEMVFRRGQ